MGTTGTLVFHQPTGPDEPFWRRYEELFEVGVVYPAPDGVNRVGSPIELASQCSNSPFRIVRLAVATNGRHGVRRASGRASV
jgi:hypothetical protein